MQRMMMRCVEFEACSANLSAHGDLSASISHLLVETRSRRVSSEAKMSKTKVPFTPQRIREIVDSMYVGEGGGGGRKKKIPRPMNSFMIFARKWRPLLQAEHRDEGNNMISRRLGNMWRGLARDEKKMWDNLAREAADQHRKLYPDYIYCPAVARVRKQDTRTNAPEDEQEQEESCDENYNPRKKKQKSNRSFCHTAVNERKNMAPNVMPHVDEDSGLRDTSVCVSSRKVCGQVLPRKPQPLTDRQKEIIRRFVCEDHGDELLELTHHPSSSFQHQPPTLEPHCCCIPEVKYEPNGVMCEMKPGWGATSYTSLLREGLVSEVQGQGLYDHISYMKQEET